MNSEITLGIIVAIVFAIVLPIVGFTIDSGINEESYDWIECSSPEDCEGKCGMGTYYHPSKNSCELYPPSCIFGVNCVVFDRSSTMESTKFISQHDLKQGIADFVCVHGKPILVRATPDYNFTENPMVC